MSAAPRRLVLTVGTERRQPENDGYIAIISMGSPQLGDEDIEVLDVAIVPSMKAAKRWYKQMKLEQPWVSRD